MRLQFAIAEMGVGGAERMVVEMLRDSSRRGDSLGLIAKPGPIDAELKGIDLARAPLPAGDNAISLLRAAAATAGFTRSFEPDVIHAHNVRVTALARFGAQVSRPWARPPLLTTYHGVPHEQVSTAARLLRLADRVVCVSADLREQLELEGLAPDRLEVIPNGVPGGSPLSPRRSAELDAELDLTGSGEVVSIVGRLVPQKAHDRFLRAVAIVREGRPEARFLIVGDGPLRHELEALSTDLRLDSAVTFTGARPDAVDLIARSDTLVFSSVWEGLSIAALEGIARGVPVVSTDVAGMRELLATGAGLIVPQDDQALAGAIAEVLSDRPRRERMGAEGRRLHAARYSIERMALAYRSLYARLAGR